jgi:hypothetical protein
MTREEIEKLEPRELDLAVAKLMGWRYRWKFGGWINPLYVTLEPPGSTEGTLAPDPLPADAVFHGCPTRYSTDIAAAWPVADTLSQVTLTQKIGAWECQCFNGIGGVVFRAETVQLAICRCALLAAMQAKEVDAAVFATPAPAAGRGER